MKNTANTVVRLLDSVSAALNLVPVPCLALAWNGFKALWDAVQKVHDSRAQLEALAGSVAEFLLTLNRKLEDQPNLARSTSKDLESLRSLIDEIHELAQQQARKAFLKRFLQGDEIITSVSTYHWRLSHFYNAFNLSCEIDNKLWQSEFDDARRRDKEDFQLLLGELKGSQEMLFRELFGKLDVQQSSLLAAITALQRGMRKVKNDNDSSIEQGFIQHSVTLLQRRSGCVVKIQPWTISSFEIEKEHKIGSGGFSNVYKAVFLGTPVALKELSATTSSKMLLNEVKVWERLRHPHILQFLGAGVDEEPPFLVTELMANGNALDFLHAKPTANRVDLVHQISLGLAYLHARKIIHGDLKANNVLIRTDESAVIADFGLSMIKTDVSSRSTAVLITGTKRWMSPERMKGRRLAPPVDIYAWAMTAYELFTGLVPFGATDESLLYELVVREEERPERPDQQTAAEVGLTEEMWLLIERSWASNAQLRPSAPDIAEFTKTVQKPSSDPFSFSPPSGTSGPPNAMMTSPAAPVMSNSSATDYTLTPEIGRAGQYSLPFNDWAEVGGWPETQNIDRISRIEISHGDVVDGIRISYQLKTGKTVTKTHGAEWRLIGADIAPSEVLSEVHGLHGDISHGWGIEIQEIAFVILDTNSGISRDLGPWGNGRARGVDMQHGSKFKISGPIMAVAGGCGVDGGNTRIKALSFVTPRGMPVEL